MNIYTRNETKTAVADNNFELVHVMVDRGIDVQAYDNLLLKVAVVYGRNEMCEFLLSRGAVPNYKALKLVAASAHDGTKRLELLEAMLPLVRDNNSLGAALVAAAANGNETAVALILRRIDAPITSELMLKYAAGAINAATIYKHYAIAREIESRTR